MGAKGGQGSPSLLFLLAYPNTRIQRLNLCPDLSDLIGCVEGLRRPGIYGRRFELGVHSHDDSLLPKRKELSRHDRQAEGVRRFLPRSSRLQFRSACLDGFPAERMRRAAQNWSLDLTALAY